jgi:hypothetical protein
MKDTTKIFDSDRRIRLIEELPRLVEVEGVARKMIDAYPDSPGARVLGEMLDLVDEEVTASPGFARDLEKERRELEEALGK